MTIPTVDMTTTGENILRLRKRAGLSVVDLNKVFGFTNLNAIYKWQNGKCLPTIDNLIILADLLNVTVDEIIARKTITTI